MSSSHSGITVDHLRPAQLWRIKASYIIGSIFVVLIVYFSCMWAMALVNTHQPITQTFSYALARDTATQITFSAWLVLFLLTRLIIFAILLEKSNIYPYAHLSTDEYVENSNEVQHIYTGIIWLYILVESIAVVSLIMILIFPDIGETTTAHFVCAALAFLSSIAGCFILLCTRLWRWRDYFKDRNIFLVLMLTANCLSVAAEIVMAIMFKVTPIDNAGVYEFVLALLIMLDSFYILIDFVIDAYDIEILFMHHEKRL